MTNITRDPKGYYVALGLDDDCDDGAVKTAFRSRAKRLHPDFNPSPIAAKQFHRLHEAYATLIDPKKRAAYDRPWKELRAKVTESATSAAGEKTSPRPESPRPESPRPERPAPEPPPRRVAPDEPVLCQCGQVTAQPRYVLFDMVWGRLRKVQRRTVGGIFCRTCADRAALRASFVSWIAGWWAWPDGPRETVRAILNNVRGGRMPADRNARLLMRQARAFKSQGNLDLARNAALQARSFARAPDVRRHVEGLISGLGPASGRMLKDRWAQPGWAPSLQMLPLALLGAIIAGTVTVALRTPSAPEAIAIATIPKSAASPKPEAPPPKPVLRAFNVASESVPLRTGPNDVFDVVSILTRGDKVTSLESDPSGAWLRVTLDDGRTGFVATADLEPTN